jgi:L-ornithine Nalpha-acyltransferase
MDLHRIGGAKARANLRRLPRPPARIIRDLEGLAPHLGKIGSLELRLALTKKEIRQAQKLRYQIFFEGGGATPDPTARLIRRDVCPFDRVCDHLIVIEHKPGDGGKPQVVGCYRLLRQDVAEANFGFYSAGEFDIAPMLARHKDKRFLELGRSCVAPGYRNKPTLELLWRGIWAYARHHRVEAMFGCASLEGAEPATHALALTYLSASAQAAEDWRVAAAPGRGVAMAMLDSAAIDPRKALRALPPLVKGYCRLGASFGGEAVVDAKFGTTDVFVIMPVADIEERYLAYFGAETETAVLAA